MKERPILFSGPMIKAMLAGRKAVTRRVVKQVPSRDYTHLKWNEGPLKGQPRWIMDWGLSDCYTDGGRHWLDIQTEVDDCSHEEISCPYGTVGDRLWVRETWQPVEHILSPGERLSTTIHYRADHEGPVLGPWRPSLFMPRWASRITLEITGVRCERLQEITPEDADAEGFDRNSDDYILHGPSWCFMNLWNQFNGKKFPWASNPFVWRIEFNRIKP